MNDEPTELERELRRFQPAPPSEKLRRRLASVLDQPAPPTVPWWQRLGFSRPAAALVWGLLSPAGAVAVALVFAGHRPTGDSLPSPTAPTVAQAENVLYQTLDEGVVLDGSREPRRRVCYRSTDQVRWHNPASGAQWEVSYPREDTLLIPIQAE